jgi:hypothetical protein
VSEVLFEVELGPGVDLVRHVQQDVGAPVDLVGQPPFHLVDARHLGVPRSHASK